MDRWDVIIILVAGYFSVMALVRMMRRRRNQMIEHFREQIEQQINSAGKQPSEENQDRDAA